VEIAGEADAILKKQTPKCRRKSPQRAEARNSGCEPDGLKAVPFKAH